MAVRGIGRLRAGGSLQAAVSLLFANGEQGAWYDPADFSTMFQDAAGTTPVTAVGQPVGRILDKSGRGNHRTQATAASRPTLRQDASGFYYLEYDGVDDWMQTASVNFSGTDKMTVFAGVHKASDAAIGSLVHLGTAGAAGIFGLLAPVSTATGACAFRAAGSDAVVTEIQASAVAGPESAVFVGAANLAGAVSQQLTIRKNGVLQGTGGTTSGGNFRNDILYFGRRGGTTLPFNGREYQTIIRGAATDAALIARVERFIGSRMGISL